MAEATVTYSEPTVTLTMTLKQAEVLMRLTGLCAANSPIAGSDGIYRALEKAGVEYIYKRITNDDDTVISLVKFEDIED